MTTLENPLHKLLLSKKILKYVHNPFLSTLSFRISLSLSQLKPPQKADELFQITPKAEPNTQKNRALRKHQTTEISHYTIQQRQYNLLQI
jgi:hypothetical protein